MKQRILMTTAAGFLALQGCASEEPSGLDLEMGVAEQQIVGAPQCSDSLSKTRAALAVAVASEIGEMNPLQHLQIVCGNGTFVTGEQYKMGLRCSTSEAIQTIGLRPTVCSGAEDCLRTKAILGFQAPSTNAVSKPMCWSFYSMCVSGDGCCASASVCNGEPDADCGGIDQAVFNANSFRHNLVTRFKLQCDYEKSLALNSPALLAPAHKLTFMAETDLNACGVHSVFSATQKCGSTPAPTVTQVQYRVVATSTTSSEARFWLKVTAGPANLDLNNNPVRYKINNDGSWSPLQVDCWSGSCTTTIGADYVDVRLGTLAAGGTLEREVRIHRADWSGMNQTNDLSFLPTMTSYGTNPNFNFATPVNSTPAPTCVEDAPFENVENLKHRMRFFDEPDQQPLDVRVEGNLIYIDPDRDDSGTPGSGSSGSCDYASMCRVAVAHKRGCCQCPGITSGTWADYPYNPQAYSYCRK